MPNPQATALPKLPGHPEPHTMQWSRLELEAIDRHGLACYEAGRAAASGQAGWQPIESAPKDGTAIYVVVADALRPEAGVAHWFSDTWRGGQDIDWQGTESPHEHFGIYPSPTHWMPLPAAPGATSPSALVASPVETQAEFNALRALTEALLTHADADYLRRQIDTAVKVMADHGCSPPVPWTDESFGLVVWGVAASPAAAGEAKVQP